MKHTATVATWCLMVGLSGFWTSILTAASRTQAPQGGVERVYKTVENTDLKLYLYGLDSKRSLPPKPAIVFFFGGGWRGGTPRQFENHCRYFASRGMVAITAEYRVSTRHKVKAVECVRDAKSAVRWIRQHAEELNVAPHKIVAAGGSAGGHLAACTSVIDALDDPSEDITISSKPNALVLFNPAVMLAPEEGILALSPSKLASLETRTGIAPKNLSPYHHVRMATPPTIIFHGQDDTTVPFSTVKAFQSRQVLYGGRSILVPFPGKGHGFFNHGRFNNEPFRQTLKASDAFLKSLGFLEGADTVDRFLAPEAGRAN